jgi:hypothetical protein
MKPGGPVRQPYSYSVPIHILFYDRGKKIAPGVGGRGGRRREAIERMVKKDRKDEGREERVRSIK